MPGQCYPAPAPVQQVRRVPIPTGGAQPPRFTSGAAAIVAMWYVAAAVPQPLQGTRQITPLTLIYGQQPPRIASMPSVQEQTAKLPWPDWPAQAGSRIVPLTLVYGQQPPRRFSLSQVQAQTISLTLAPDW